MKSKTLIFVFVYSFLLSYTFAQDYTFRVLVNKGKNEVKTGANWEPLKVGTSLKLVDEIRVAENSYLGLIHAKGQPLELKAAGKYKVSDLDARVGKGPSVLNKYTEFILSSNTQRKGNLTATGAVHRGTNNIKVFLPPSETSYVYGDSITIQWAKDKSPGPYIVTFTDIFSTELSKVETTQNSITVNLNDNVFNNESDLQVKVISKSDKKVSDDYVIRRMSKANKEKLKPAYMEMANQTKENTALNKLVQASFFEQNKLIIEAATAYQKAVKLEPSYQDMYNEFLLRNGLKDAKDK